jgi:hypothetical protein
VNIETCGETPLSNKRMLMRYNIDLFSFVDTIVAYTALLKVLTNKEMGVLLCYDQNSRG